MRNRLAVVVVEEGAEGEEIEIATAAEAAAAAAAAAATGTQKLLHSQSASANSQVACLAFQRASRFQDRHSKAVAGARIYTQCALLAFGVD